MPRGDKNFALTRHAAQRAQEMGLTRDELVATARRPDRVLQSGTKPDCTVYQRGRLALVIDPYGKIVTVLWNRLDVYHR